MSPTPLYKLYIYGDERIEDQKLYFSRLEPAVATVERQCTDDNTGWKFNDKEMKFIDYNNGCAVINTITKVKKENVESSVEIRNEPFW